MDQQLAYRQQNKFSTVLIALLFALWPLLGFLAAMMYFKGDTQKIIYTVLYFCVIGYSIRYIDTNADAARYASDFMFYKDEPLLNIFTSEIEGMSDFFSRLSMYIVGKVSSDPSSLFVFWGAIYGFVVSSCILFIVNRVNNPHKLLPLFFMMYILNPHSNINGMRFWFATWVYLYSLLRLLDCKEKKWLILMLSTFLIHNAMAIGIIVYFIYLYTKPSPKVLVLIMFVSFILGHTLPVTDIFSNISLITTNEHYSMYIDEESVQEWIRSNDEKSTLNVFMTSLPFYFCLWILYYWGNIINSVGKHTNKCDTRYIYSLYAVCVIFYSMLCFFRSFPSLGSRFGIITYMLVMIVAMLLIDMRVLRKAKAWTYFIVVVFSGLVYLSFVNMSVIMNVDYILPSFLIV